MYYILEYKDRFFSEETLARPMIVCYIIVKTYVYTDVYDIDMYIRRRYDLSEYNTGKKNLNFSH